MDLSVGNVKIATNTPGFVLVIDPVTSLDEGSYQCVAKNKNGRDVSSITILRRAGEWKV